MTNGAKREPGSAALVRHRPQQAPNALSGYIAKASDALIPRELTKSAVKRRRRKPKQNSHPPEVGTRRWIVSIHGMAEPEELEDDDEFQDVYADLANEFEKFGSTVAFSIDRNSGVVTVEYAEETFAVEAVQAKNGQRYGGRLVIAAVEPDARASPPVTRLSLPTEAAETSVPTPPVKTNRRRSKIKNAVIKSREARESRRRSRVSLCSFIVRNMVEACEVEDDDEYEEVVEEAKQHLSRHGEIALVSVCQGNDEGEDRQAGDVVVEFADGRSARQAFDALNGSLYGGRTLTCTWIPAESGGCCRVTIDGMVGAEELQDDDEFADVCEEVQTYLVGQVGDDDGKLDVQVSQVTGQVTLVFDSRECAVDAVQRLEQKLYGGRKLDVQLHLVDTTTDTTETREQDITKSASVPVRDHSSEVMTRLLTNFLQRLTSLQERAHVQNPLQDKRSRRLVLGLHEVRRGVRSHKIKLLLLAKDFDECDVLDTKLVEIVDIATREEVPIVRALTRRKFGRILKKNGRVSCAGVYSYDGANELFREILQELHRLEHAAARDL